METIGWLVVCFMLLMAIIYIQTHKPVRETIVEIHTTHYVYMVDMLRYMGAEEWEIEFRKDKVVGWKLVIMGKLILYDPKAEQWLYLQDNPMNARYGLWVPTKDQRIADLFAVALAQPQVQPVQQPQAKPSANGNKQAEPMFSTKPANARITGKGLLQWDDQMKRSQGYNMTEKEADHLVRTGNNWYLFDPGSAGLKIQGNGYYLDKLVDPDSGQSVWYILKR